MDNLVKDNAYRGLLNIIQNQIICNNYQCEEDNNQINA